MKKEQEKKEKQPRQSRRTFPQAEELVEIIYQHRQIVTINDLCAEIKFSRRSFCEYYHPETEGSIMVYEALENNKTKLKQTIREKLLECKNPAALIALYKLLATKEELEAISSTYKPKEEASLNKDIELKIE